ncbi:septum formation initiator family protein [Streptomyces sp. NPDC050617]|uniref:FtsB family cell division protein n=1 Tax=Streptomyces sp. NPDC050617 TaxID=3154628 RepID=UPI00343A5B32
MTAAARRPGGLLGRLLPAGPAGAKRTPFVLLVVVLLGSGLIGLLVLNSSLNQGSFELSRLEKQTTELTDEQQSLQQDVDKLSAPDALDRRARELGMVPGGNPAFLGPDGTVHGSPSPAPEGDEPVSYTVPVRPQPPVPLQAPAATGAPGVPGQDAAPPARTDVPATPTPGR